MFKKKYMKGGLLLFVFCCFSFVAPVKAAKNRGIVVYGTYRIDAGATQGTRITLFQNGAKVKSNISGDGEFKYSLTFNKQYELVFAKDGYITKKVYVSTDVPERVLKSNNDFPPFKVEITLYRKVKGGDYSIFDEPVAMVIYDKELDDFDFDKAYNVEVEERIKEVETQIAAAVAAVPAKPDNLLAYKQKIKKADDLFDSTKYQEAREAYQEAMQLNPKDAYPKSRLKDIQKELAVLAQQEKDAIAKKQKEESFAKILKEADALFVSLKYEEAKKAYKKANKINPKNTRPKEQIEKIEGLMAQQEELNRDYKKALVQGDRLFKRKKYAEAKDSYEKALALKQSEVYPQKQLAQIESLIATKEQKQEQDLAYDKAINEADSLFELKKWEGSKKMYMVALGVKPDKRYPNYKISDIDFKLRKEKERMAEQATVKAKREDRTYSQVEVAEAEAPKVIKNDTYKEAVGKGDEAFVKKDWTQARMHYFKALKEKPSHEYLNARIATIDERIAEKKTKKETVSKYEELIAQADKAFEEESWEEALEAYRKAFLEATNKSYARNQIRRIENHFQAELDKSQQKEKDEKLKVLFGKADELYAKGALEDALEVYDEAKELSPKNKELLDRIGAINEEISQKGLLAEKEQKFKDELTKGDSAYEAEDWITAIVAYSKALAINDADSVRNKLESSRSAVADESKKRKQEKADWEKTMKQAVLDENINKGKLAFEQKKYRYAKNYYENAQSVDPSEETINGKLDDLEVLIAQQEEEEKPYYTRLVFSEKDRELRYYEPVKVSYGEGEKRFVKLIGVESMYDEEYNKLISKAEEALSKNNYLFAKSFYQQAYNVKPSPVLLVKIQELIDKM